MLLPVRLADPIARGEVTLAYRRWKRVGVIAGRTYRTGAGRIVIADVREVDPAAIADADARRAGEVDAHSVRSQLRGDPGLPIYRITFGPATDADPRAALARQDDLSDDDRAAITARLTRLDRAATDGPWTTSTLRAIATHPGVVARALATELGRERDPFKRDVRKLKALGLTESLAVGYRLSPRGESYLRHVQRRHR